MTNNSDDKCKDGEEHEYIMSCGTLRVLECIKCNKQKVMPPRCGFY